MLHEADIVPGFGDDPLTWVDLLNFVMLIYAVYFQFYGLARRSVAATRAARASARCGHRSRATRLRRAVAQGSSPSATLVSKGPPELS